MTSQTTSGGPTPTHTTLGQLTEAQALAAITPLLPRGAATVVGPGDDSAVVALDGHRVVVSTDSLIEGPDFLREWSTPFDIGWKAAAVNLADIASMGAAPAGLVVAFAAPPTTPIDDLVELARGLAAACAELAPAVGVVGGDLASAPVLTIAVTAFGSLTDGQSPVLRSGAQVGDVVAYAGARGDSARALALLFAEATDEQGRPDAAKAQALRATRGSELEAQLQARPAIAAGIAAGVAGAHAMIDVSDGLSLDASRVARASGVGIRFESAAFADDFALHGGEDHGMLATFDPATPLPEGFVRLGVVTDEAGVLRLDDEVLEPRGWEALRSKSQ